MKLKIRRDAYFSNLVNFEDQNIRKIFDLQFRSQLLAETQLGLHSRAWSKLLDFGAGDQSLKARICAHQYFSVDLFLPADWSDLNQIPKGQNFDLIAAVEVFEHLPNPREVLRQLSSLQKQGNQLYLTTPFLAREHGAPNDYQRWTAAGLCLLLEQTGYRVTQVLRRGGFFSVQSSLLNYWFFKNWKSRLFFVCVLLCPIVFIFLLLAHIELRFNSGNDFYMGLSILAERSADFEKEIKRD